MTKVLKIAGEEGRTAGVGKIVCLGRNYRAHAAEMGVKPPLEPVIFLKPSSSVIGDGEDIVIPPGIGEVHHEVELAVVVGTACRAVPARAALDMVMGYAVLLDVTARDLQAKAKRAGLPWTLSKGLDTFCPVSSVTPASRVPDPGGLRLKLSVNGKTRQDGSTADMIWSVPELMEYISARMSLEPGDIIATGTPEGVSAIVPGDTVEASIEGVGSLRCGVVG